MALVIKSWKVSSHPAPGEPHVAIVARDSGLLSFFLAIVGIDATTTMQVTGRHVFFEQGALSGFQRRFIPLPNIASTYYGRVKPWKSTLVFIVLSLGLGSSMMGHGTGGTILGTLLVLGGTALSFLYYFLNRELSIGVVDVSSYPASLSFKRSLIEGQEIDEKAAESVIQIIEHLIKPNIALASEVSLGSSSQSGVMGAAAPKNLAELARNLAMSTGATAPTPGASAAQLSACPKCNTSVQGNEVFCGNCGFKLS